MKTLRTLEFKQLEESVSEAQDLLRLGYNRNGNWSLGQICRHLRLVQDPSIDGYPGWMSLFAFLRPIMRRLLLPRLLGSQSPRGIPTAATFEPGIDLDDASEVEHYSTSVRRLTAHQGDFVPHPAFGKLDRDRILGLVDTS